MLKYLWIKRQDACDLLYNNLEWGVLGKSRKKTKIDLK